ncbi:MAG: hypothetical protein AAB876_02920 [Patescibacteria group bacterium]
MAGAGQPTETERPTKYAVTQKDIFGIVRTFRVFWNMSLKEVEKVFPNGKVRTIPPHTHQRPNR